MGDASKVARSQSAVRDARLLDDECLFERIAKSSMKKSKASVSLEEEFFLFLSTC